jgi:hypothetical protein
MLHSYYPAIFGKYKNKRLIIEFYHHHVSTSPANYSPLQLFSEFPTYFLPLPHDTKITDIIRGSPVLINVYVFT